MTAKLVDDITETGSDKDRESRGQGIANVITGFFGGMAGCAMIGQTMINVRVSGARTRISTFCAGAFLLVLVVGLGSVVAVIPMAALVAVMILVVGLDLRLALDRALDAAPHAPGGDVDHGRHRGGHRCHSQPGDRRRCGRPHGDGGLRTPGRAPGRGRSRRRPRRDHLPVLGPRRALLRLRPGADRGIPTTPSDPPSVVIDFSRAHLWDASAIAAVDAIEGHYHRHDIEVSISGLNERSDALHQRLSGQVAAH